MNVRTTTITILQILLPFAMLFAMADASANLVRFNTEGFDSTAGSDGTAGHAPVNLWAGDNEGSAAAQEGSQGDDSNPDSSGPDGGYGCDAGHGQPCEHDWHIPSAPGLDSQNWYTHFQHDSGNHLHAGYPPGLSWLDEHRHDWNVPRHGHCPTPAVVPLPATLVLLLSGLTGMLVTARSGRAAQGSSSP